MLPRAGGVLDQPGNEMMYLEAILDAFASYEAHQQRREASRAKVKAQQKEEAK